MPVRWGKRELGAQTRERLPPLARWLAAKEDLTERDFFFFLTCGVEKVEQEGPLVGLFHPDHFLGDVLRGGADTAHGQENVILQEITCKDLVVFLLFFLKEKKRNDLMTSEMINRTDLLDGSGAQQQYPRQRYQLFSTLKILTDTGTVVPLPVYGRNLGFFFS